LFSSQEIAVLNGVVKVKVKEEEERDKKVLGGRFYIFFKPRQFPLSPQNSYCPQN
jgi:hypothetical protein